MMVDRFVPYDWESVSTAAEWRNAVAHPMLPAEIHALLERQLADVLGAIAALPDRAVRDAALLCAHDIMGTARAVLVAAVSTEKSRRSSMTLISGNPVVQYLLSASDSGGPPPLPDMRRGRPEHPSLAGLRAIARALSWKASAFMRRPDAIAVTHNSLLADAARHEANVRFCHAGVYFQGLAAVEFSPDPDMVLALTRAMTAQLADGSREGAAARCYLQPMVRRELGRAQATRAQLGKIAVLPSVLWSATGGQYWSRALGLEVMRRGGQAVRFDHGGTTGLVVAPGARMLTELSVSTRFSAATPAAADAVRGALANGPGRELAADIRITGQRGDPHFASASALKPRAHGGRLRVLYAPSILFGFRFVFPPALPDLIYLDWQFRLVEALKRLPVDLICRPHPEGIFSGRLHPLQALTGTEPRRFEQLMEEADVIVLDYPLSTTFGYSLCTEKPVVYLDVGIGRIEPAMKSNLDKRARVVACASDSRNRPVLDEKALADAIFSQDPVDPAPFRLLFLG
jgi:hypothetical protein